MADEHPDDIDLYVQDPTGKLVWYNQKEVGLMTLERDDRGDTNDFTLIERKKIGFRSARNSSASAAPWR